MEISISELKDLMSALSGSLHGQPTDAECWHDQFLDIHPKDMKSLLYKWMKLHSQDDAMTPSFLDEMFRVPFEYYLKNTSPSRIECKKNEYARQQKRKRDLKELPTEKMESMTEEQIFEWEFNLSKTFVWDPYWRECFTDRFGRIPRMENT